MTASLVARGHLLVIAQRRAGVRDIRQYFLRLTACLSTRATFERPALPTGGLSVFLRTR
jgi:hypothetical protein